MNPQSSQHPMIGYVKSLFESDDTICITLIQPTGKVSPLFCPALDAEASSDALSAMNTDANVYVCMNALKAGSTRRRKEDVSEIRSVYIDIDNDGDRQMADIQKSVASGEVPKPHFILQSSPGKYQVIWCVSGFDQAAAESLNRALVQRFGGDAAATDSVRILRLPGFKNLKYPTKPVVEVVEQNDAPRYGPESFKVTTADAMKPNAPQPSQKPETALVKHGSIHPYMVSLIGRLRQSGLNAEEIEPVALRMVHENCEPPIDDSKVVAAVKSVCKYEAGPDNTAFIGGQVGQIPAVDVSAWYQQFRSVAEMEQGEPVMVIDGVLQEGTCFIAAVPGECKTLLALSMAKSISDGTPFLGLEQFRVPEARPVVYLIPESRDRAFRKRCEAFRITNEKSKFMARTLSSGLPLELGDTYLLEAVKALKPIVFLDTATRFMKSTDENSAAQNRELFNDVSKLLVAGAVTVVLVHHATKASKKEKMTQENMLRGSSDLAAMCDQSYGIQRDNVLYEYGAGPLEINLVSLKDREQTGALTTIRLAATVKESKLAVPVSCINKTGNFVVVNPEEMQRKTSESVVRLVELDPNRPAKDMAVALGMTEYGVKKMLRDAGWHSVQGGKHGASPWHKDNGEPCPYAKETRSRVKTITVDLEQPKAPVN